MKKNIIEGGSSFSRERESRFFKYICFVLKSDENLINKFFSLHNSGNTKQVLELKKNNFVFVLFI